MWIGHQFLALSGGALVPGSLRLFSAMCLSDFRDNREATPVKVQKGGE